MGANEIANQRQDLAQRILKNIAGMQQGNTTQHTSGIQQVQIPTTPQQNVVGRTVPLVGQLGESAAADKLLDFLLDALTPVERQFIEALLVPRRFLPTVMNLVGRSFNTTAFVGRPDNIVIVRFAVPQQPASSMALPQLIGVYEIPPAVVKALIAEEVEKILKD